MTSWCSAGARAGSSGTTRRGLRYLTHCLLRSFTLILNDGIKELTDMNENMLALLATNRQLIYDLNSGVVLWSLHVLVLLDVERQTQTKART